MRFYTIVFCLFSFSSLAQTIEEVKSLLGNISTREQANEFAAAHPEITSQVFELNSLTDTSDLDVQLMELGIGKVLEFESQDKQKYFFFKVLEEEKVTSFRAQYIFLDGSKLSLKQIDSVRSVIMKRLKKGEQFGELAKTYSMDVMRLKDGDLGWFEEGMMVKEFEDPIRKKKVGDVFTVDVTSNKWYYVVKKTHEARVDRKVTVVYVEVVESE